MKSSLFLLTAPCNLVRVQLLAGSRRWRVSCDARCAQAEGGLCHRGNGERRQRLGVHHRVAVSLAAGAVEDVGPSSAPAPQTHVAAELAFAPFLCCCKGAEFSVSFPVACGPTRTMLQRATRRRLRKQSMRGYSGAIPIQVTASACSSSPHCIPGKLDQRW